MKKVVRGKKKKRERSEKVFRNANKSETSFWWSAPFISNVEAWDNNIQRKVFINQYGKIFWGLGGGITPWKQLKLSYFLWRSMTIM